jgi:hypothetical protein
MYTPGRLSNTGAAWQWLSELRRRAAARAAEGGLAPARMRFFMKKN